MKSSFRPLWPALTCLFLLSACTTYQGPDPNYDPSHCSWKFVSDGHTAQILVVEEKGNIWREVSPGYPQLVITPRRDVIHLRMRVKNNHGGWALDEISPPPIRRSGRWSGIQEVKIDDYLIYDAPLLRGYIDNAFGQDIINVKFRGKKIAQLNAGDFREQSLTPGPVTVYWQTKPNGRVYEYRTCIINDDHKTEFNGKMVDWVITLERK